MIDLKDNVILASEAEEEGLSEIQKRLRRDTARGAITSDTLRTLVEVINEQDDKRAAQNPNWTGPGIRVVPE
jgi:hypothetical protein